MKLGISVVALAFAMTHAAFAGGHQGNRADAAAMVDNIKAYGGNLATAIAPQGPYFGVGGKPGWGNAGSLLTGNGTVDVVLDTDVGTDGGQVSATGDN